MSGEAVLAPLTGRLHGLEDVPDPVFAQGLVGPGVAIEPTQDGDVDVIAPISGKIAKIHPHAFVIVAGRVNVLVHLGLDTVKLEGEGFTVHAHTGDTVSAGDTLITWNPREIEAKGLSTMCPVIFMETKAEVTYSVEPGSDVEASAQLATTH